MMPTRDNTVRIKYPPESAKPTETEIVRFLVKHNIIGDNVTAVYPDVRAKCYFVKFVSDDYAKNFVESATKDGVFEYSNKVTTNVSVYDANEDIRVVRIFELAPEIHDDDVKAALQAYGDIKNITWEQTKTESNFSFYNGVRAIQMNVTAEVPDRITLSGEKKRVSYPGMVEKCYRCNQAGHKRFQCPNNAQFRLQNPANTLTNNEVNFPPLPGKVIKRQPLAPGLSSVYSVEELAGMSQQQQANVARSTLNPTIDDTQRDAAPQPNIKEINAHNSRSRVKKPNANSERPVNPADNNTRVADEMLKPITITTNLTAEEIKNHLAKLDEKGKREFLAKLRDRSRIRTHTSDKNSGGRSRSNSRDNKDDKTQQV